MDRISLWLLLFSSLLFSSCSKRYQIEGRSSISLLDGRMLYLKVPVGNDLVNIDSAEVIHGSFQMAGRVDSTVVASLFMDNQNVMPVILEKGSIVITIENSKLHVQGTPLNNSLYDYIEQRNSLESHAYELERTESRMIMEGHSLEQVEIKMNEVRQSLLQQVTALNKSFIQKNYTNLLGPSLFLMVCEGYDSPVMPHFIKQILDEAPACFKENVQVQSYIDVVRSSMQDLRSESESLSGVYSSLVSH
ncbi:MAG: DUF4369 domain-containing protein [Phocaeicola sp.]